MVYDRVEETWFNPERKKWYLDYCKKNVYEETTIKLIERIFTSTAISENVFKKDVSEFNQENVVDLLKSYDSKSPQRLRVLAYYLREYYQWCYNQNIVTNIINPFDERTTQIIIEQIIPPEVYADKYFGKEQLKDWVENRILDDINKFIVLAYFYGLDYDELTNLKIGDLDEQTKTVKLITGRIAYVDDFFIKYMKKANLTTEYKVESVAARITNYKAYIYNNGNYVVRTTGGEVDDNPVKVTFLNTRLNIARDQIGNEFVTKANLYKNGLIWYIKEKYEAQEITLKTAIFHQINKKLYTYDTQTQEYINEFGSKMTVRMLRMYLKDTIDYYN